MKRTIVRVYNFDENFAKRRKQQYNYSTGSIGVSVVIPISSTIHERFAMFSLQKNLFIYVGLLLSCNILCNNETSNKALPAAAVASAPVVAVFQGDFVSIVRPASPVACPDQYCSMVKKAVLGATRCNNSAIHVNFGQSLLPVFQTIAFRNYDFPETTFKAIHRELIITLWKRRLGKLMLDLLGERQISGLSITGFILQDRAIFIPMIENLLQGNSGILKLRLDYVVGNS